MHAEEFTLDTSGERLTWACGKEPILSLPRAAIVEVTDADHPTIAGDRFAGRYGNIDQTFDQFVGTGEIRTPRASFNLTDTWHRIADDTWQVDRRLEAVSAAVSCGVRLLLELLPCTDRRAYADFRYFAPPALTDLNDLNEDGLEDYLETRSLHFREDRLNLRSVLVWNDSHGIGFVLSRADRPEFDTIPDRPAKAGAFLQRTDIGSLGVEPLEDGGVAMVAAYPFAERSRSNALLVKERAPFAAFAPVVPGVTLSASWLVRLVGAADVHGALWAMWTRRYAELAPVPVTLSATVPDIAAARVDAALDYFIEEKDAPFAAGFVTNCHPQDGKQISDVIQFGFTGQNNLNAFNLLRDGDARGDADRRRKALRVFDFFVTVASRNRFGLIPGYYNADTRKFGFWWTGLILPLAYAEPGADLEALMGPLYRHLREVITALAGRQGVYLRCVVEEYDALLRAYRYENRRGAEPGDWLTRARPWRLPCRGTE